MQVQRLVRDHGSYTITCGREGLVLSVKNTSNGLYLPRGALQQGLWACNQMMLTQRNASEEHPWQPSCDAHRKELSRDDSTRCSNANSHGRKKGHDIRAHVAKGLGPHGDLD